MLARGSGGARVPVERIAFSGVRSSEELLEGQASLGDGFGLGAELALEERGVIVANRQDAARLAGDDRPALARPFVETLDIVPGVGHGLIEQAVGNERPAAAAQVRRAERDRAAGSVEQCDRRPANLGLESNW